MSTVNRSYRLVCPLPGLETELSQGLTQLGWVLRPQAPVGLLIDAPWTHAFTLLESLEPGRWVVVTDNPCPEAWLDLWDLGVLGVLAGGHRLTNLASALERSLSGKRTLWVPHQHSPLTPAERKVLRLNAMGQSQKLIAEELGVSLATVRSHLKSIYVKLRLKGHEAAILYYVGLWHFLSSYAQSARHNHQ